MSRIRIVEGTTTIYTKGNHYMYSEGNITFNAQGFINETAESYSYGDPIEAPVLIDEKRIVEIYWTFGDTKLGDKSRFYVDMNLVVKTINYEEGESITVCIKSEDGQALTDNLKELNLTKTVNKNNIVIFEKVLKDYTLNLLEKDDIQ